jgi:hypothetical protein
VIAGAVVVSVITGAFLGWVLAMVTASAAMSHSQARMQRKVRYWQSEAALARAQVKAARLARYAVAEEDLPPPGPSDWPSV